MKHYSLTMKLFDNDGLLADNQVIDFIPFHCNYQGVVIKKASPNKKMIFCTFTALVDVCQEAICEDEYCRWEIRGFESDNESGEQRYINFWASAVDDRKIYTDVDGIVDGKVIECGSRYDEFFDNWLF